MTCNPCSPSVSVITMVVVGNVPLSMLVPLNSVKPSEFSGISSERIVKETFLERSRGWKVNVWFWKEKSCALASPTPFTKETITESVRSDRTSRISGISRNSSTSGSGNSYLSFSNPTLGTVWGDQKNHVTFVAWTLSEHCLIYPLFVSNGSYM